MRAITFCFDTYPEQVFPGFAVGSTWNGFDNVCVTPETAREIDAFFAANEPNEDAPIGDTPPRWQIWEHGKVQSLIDLSNGYCTVLCCESCSVELHADPPFSWEQPNLCHQCNDEER